MSEDSHPGIATVIIAPTGRDGGVLRQACERVGVYAPIAFDAASLRGLLAEGRADVLVLTQEALTGELVDTLGRAGTSAAWDQLPVLLLVDAGSNSLSNMGKLEGALPDVQLVVLERPLRFPEFHSALDMLRRSRRRQYEVRDLLERERELRRELNHRVKNILSTVQALYALSARKADDLDAFSTSFQGRLNAMARVHDELFAKNFRRTDISALLQGVLKPYASSAGHLTTCGPSIDVSPEAAQDIALCAHELGTNAAKYGALSRTDGTVSVDWSNTDGMFVFRWIEAGGPAVSEPDRTGFGTMFLSSSMSRFDGTCVLDFDPTGLRATLTAPLDQLQGEAQ